MITLAHCVVLAALAQLPGSPGDGAAALPAPPAPSKTPPGADAPAASRLIPPAVATPGVRLTESVVPGGEVYRLPQWFVDLMNELTHKPVPKPTPVPSPVPVPTPVPPPVAGEMPTPAQIVEGVNQLRRGLNLPALENDGKLTGMAVYWSQWQALHNVVTHGPGQSFSIRMNQVYPNVPASEIAAGDFRSVPEVIAAWKSSPGHYAAMKGPYNKAGGGVAKGRDGRWYWTVDLVNDR